MKRIIKNDRLIFWGIIIVLAVIKQLLIGSIPLLAYSNQVFDDSLMVNLADNIQAGNWLGEYNEMTLVKGSFFPLYLACISKIGLSFMGFTNLLYTFSCVIFCIGIHPLFKNKWLLLILYTLLLFNPVSVAAWTFQRVYRNGITLSQVLLIFGAIFAIYLRRKYEWKVLIPWAVLAGVTLITLWHTREDGIWILPFVFVAIIVLIIIEYIQFRKRREKKIFICRGIICFLPLILLFVGNNIIRTINYAQYGIFSYNEINDSSFADAIKSIYSVENNDIVPYVSATREKIERLYAVSPTLNGIKTELEMSMDTWDYNDRNPGDGEVEDGWFFWSLRAAVKAAGYADNAPEAEKFYSDISMEIEKALDEEKTKIIRQNTMPSAAMSPWRKSYLKELPSTMVQVVAYLIRFDEVEARNESGSQTEDNGIRLFESLTNDMAIYPDDNSLSVEGWYVQRGGKEYNLALVDENEKIVEKIEKIKSKDVYEYLCNEGINEQTARKCRFSVDMQDIGELGSISLASISKEGKIYNKIPLDYSMMNGKTEEYVFIIDRLKKGTDFRRYYTEKYVNRWNKITGIYKNTNWIFFILACLSGAFISFRFVKNRKIKDGESLLLLGSILASMIVLIGGISYSEISAFASIMYMYLSGAYPLLLAFEGIAILYVFDEFKYKKGKKQNYGKC